MLKITVSIIPKKKLLSIQNILSPSFDRSIESRWESIKRVFFAVFEPIISCQFPLAVSFRSDFWEHLLSALVFTAISVAGNFNYGTSTKLIETFNDRQIFIIKNQWEKLSIENTMQSKTINILFGEYLMTRKVAQKCLKYDIFGGCSINDDMWLIL